ncbi:MAG: hypothetical protein ABSG93_07600 [Solirubrobacteraceae bacterium]|jgi:hypothetical protein
MPKTRYQPPDRLPGATDFSKRPDLCGSLNVVRLLKSQRWAWDDLREACAALESDYARHREPGHWELAAVAFVVSGQVDVKPWWANTTDELWRECGFPQRPPYKRTWERLRELEDVHDEFLRAASTVIKRCRMHDERVMAHVHVDYTEDETHAALVHDCQPGEPCKRRTTTRSGRPRKATGHPLRLQRAATTEARERREAWNEQELPDSEKHEAEDTPREATTVQRGGRTVKRVKVGGCWYVTRDVEAGVRAYTGNGKVKRFWHGYYSGKAVDHYTGGVVPSVDAASKQECHLFNDLFDRATNMAGAAPQTVIGDRGFSVEACFQHATENNCAPVFPWRRCGDGKRHDKPTHDRHGVKRCRHCGGVMHQVRFSANGGKPRLWFRCTFQLTPDCGDEQTIYCHEDWRALIPLPRTSALYHELRKSHRSYEAVHDYWRDRYRVASDNLANRPKSVGIGWHRLRASVASLIDWLRIAAKAGWLGSTRSARRHAGERPFKDAGRKAADQLASIRARIGLYKPYGPQASKTGHKDATAPPSQRPRGAPPGARRKPRK